MKPLWFDFYARWKISGRCWSGRREVNTDQQTFSISNLLGIFPASKYWILETYILQDLTKLVFTFFLSFFNLRRRLQKVLTGSWSTVDSTALIPFTSWNLSCLKKSKDIRNNNWREPQSLLNIVAADSQQMTMQSGFWIGVASTYIEFSLHQNSKQNELHILWIYPLKLLLQW